MPRLISGLGRRASRYRAEFVCREFWRPWVKQVDWQFNATTGATVGAANSGLNGRGHRGIWSNLFVADHSGTIGEFNAITGRR
jgi:hypothetical protein